MPICVPVVANPPRRRGCRSSGGLPTWDGHSHETSVQLGTYHVSNSDRGSAGCGGQNGGGSCGRLPPENCGKSDFPQCRSLPGHPSAAERQFCGRSDLPQLSRASTPVSQPIPTRAHVEAIYRPLDVIYGPADVNEGPLDVNKGPADVNEGPGRRIGHTRRSAASYLSPQPLRDQPCHLGDQVTVTVGVRIICPTTGLHHEQDTATTRTE
ncbi:hypothetical protein SAMN05445060_0332 [Williamsia sterculiae]|uniref:Uncharacterized protein n=1 Tax=Williamsia sterculiae TaxID=1344003 RepID=A0A1N7CS08_9NOCA|nr:hypothetical protein SAMN05445060_0332 [Williamsia sterculiae]